MKILWISPYAPYDNVGHAGGQNHNYYLKYVKNNTNYEIMLLSVCNKEESSKLDLNQYGIRNIVKEYDEKKIKHRIQSIWGKIDIRRDGGLLDNAKYHLLIDALLQYKIINKDEPQIIVMQWTEVTVIIDCIRKYYPNSIYIAIEEDVAFQGYFRKYMSSKGILKIYKKMKYRFLKKAEIEALHKCNHIVTLNEKDKKLLTENGIEESKILKACPYFKLNLDIVYNPNQYNLLFYGAMSRKENYLSAIWFIKNVMPNLDKCYKLYVVGANPSKEIMRYQSNRIIVTGYVEDIKPYFESSLCLVAPLLLGAGIKIKILEALAAGVPVLTNEIGAEGIQLTNKINYLYCKEAIDYKIAIEKLTNDIELRKQISIAGNQHIVRNFNTNNSLNKLIGIMENYDNK